MQTDVRMIQLLMELRRQGITDTEVLSAMETTPRELFVPAVFQDRAYDNVALPVNAGADDQPALCGGLHDGGA